jgi:hypothetical protein
MVAVSNKQLNSLSVCRVAASREKHEDSNSYKIIPDFSGGIFCRHLSPFCRVQISRWSLKTTEYVRYQQKKKQND